MFIVEKNNKIRLTQQIIDELENNIEDVGDVSDTKQSALKKTNITWKNLLVGINKKVIHSDTDDRCYVTNELLEIASDEDESASKEGKIISLISYLREEGGIIEYIDVEKGKDVEKSI